MNDIQLNDLTLAELKQLQKQIAKSIAGYGDHKKREAVTALEARAQQLGFSLADLIGVKKTRKSSGSAGPKYRHPENAEITWSGRGRQPAWFKAAVEAGKAPSSMAV
jgi:DNA-binding protein H-NS